MPELTPELFIEDWYAPEERPAAREEFVREGLITPDAASGEAVQESREVTITADAFLRELFKIAPGNACAWITAFTVDPSKAGAPHWKGRLHVPAIPLPDFDAENAYVSVAGFPPTATARLSTTQHSTLAVVLDDVGTKAEPNMVRDTLGEPSARVATSDGNEQWWYFATAPIDKRDIDVIHEALKARGALSDRSGLNSVRYVRLPAGINTKDGKRRHAVHLVEWAPQRRYSLSYFRDCLCLSGARDSNGYKARYTTPDAVFEGTAPPEGMRPGDTTGRNQELLAYGSSLSRSLSGAQVLEAMRDFNVARLVPPCSEEEVLATFRSVCRYHPELAGEPQGEYAGMDPRIADEVRALGPDDLVLPSDYVPVPFAAARIFGHMAARRDAFTRGGRVVELDPETKTIEPLSPDAFRSRLDGGGRCTRSAVTVRDQLVLRLKRCSADTARVLLASREARDCLPPIGLVVRSPILVEVNSELRTLGPGYHPDAGGVLVLDDAELIEVSTAEATEALLALLDDFKFATPADRSRALGNLIGPALRMGRLLPGHATINVTEADKSQAGKGYLLACGRALYAEPGYDIAKRDGGVGSLDESIGAALFSGTPFITLDNLRGRVSSQFWEHVMTTHGAVRVRLPHKGEVPVDVSRVTFHATSNNFESTADLGNRSMVTGLLKQPDGYGFRRFPAGDLLAHIRANQPYYLGCVFALVHAWHSAGKPRLPTTHSFTDWVGALDWIVQRLGGLVPILGGHSAVVARVTDPGLSWLRAVAHAAVKEGLCGKELSATELAHVSERAGIGIPGAETPEEDAAAARRIGTLLAPRFKQCSDLSLDSCQVRRVEAREYNAGRKEYLSVKRYVFTKTGDEMPQELDA